ncbi:MAG: hypothetical protein M3457_07630 [Chloroflexota bacterium]|nr:hypothetical protein [Chloroflexota bacterium]
MEALIMVVVLVAIAILADRFGGHRRPVHHSLAYQQALTGMIGEPRGQTQIVNEPRDYAVTRMKEITMPEPASTPPDLTVQPT